MKKSTLLLLAALFCGSLSTFAQDDELRITPAMNDDGDPTFTFNKDYKYYGILLDNETKEANLTDDQYVYIGADDESGRHLYIWDGSSKFLESPSGLNSFGVPGEYLAYQVGNAGWSGLGYTIDEASAVDLSGITNEYTFHMALMATANDPVDFYLTDGSGRSAHLVFSDAAAFDQEPIGNISRDGEWYNIDIPMTYLEDNFGLNFTKDKAYSGNILCLLAGGNEGFTINYDAVFFYGPKGSSTGVKEIKAAEKNAPVSIYTTDGKLVSKQFANANKGMYIVKQAGKTKKVVL